MTPLVGELEAELANLRAEHQSDPEVFIELYDGTIVHWCTGCRSDWPCPTARALDAFDVERSRSERYREALGFYAAETTWGVIEGNWTATAPVDFDQGNRARAALVEVEEE